MGAAQWPERGLRSRTQAAAVLAGAPLLAVAVALGVGALFVLIAAESPAERVLGAAGGVGRLGRRAGAVADDRDPGDPDRGRHGARVPRRALQPRRRGPDDPRRARDRGRRPRAGRRAGRRSRSSAPCSRACSPAPRGRSLPGWWEAWFRVPLVVTTLLLNYIAALFATYLAGLSAARQERRLDGRPDRTSCPSALQLPIVDRRDAAAPRDRGRGRAPARGAVAAEPHLARLLDAHDRAQPRLRGGRRRADAPHDPHHDGR